MAMSKTPITDAMVSASGAFVEHRARELCERLEERVQRADHIILLLTADHNTGKNYVKGFDMAQEYFQDFPND